MQDDRKIAPLMLQPFIENAFKYGISLREASPIIIRITVHENLLEFYCKNKIVRKSPTAGEPSGIGINNTKRDSICCTRSGTNSYFRNERQL